MDFGCSALCTPGVPLTCTRGTPTFMAPEVMRRSYGLPADLWSVGILYYQAREDLRRGWVETPRFL
jgi:serine/threonine protein kinase